MVVHLLFHGCIGIFQVQNLGRRTSSPASFSVLAIDPLGSSTELITTPLIGSLAPGASQTVTADWPVGSESGEYTLVVFIDVENAIAELSEANNTVIMSQPVSGDSGLVSSIALDSAEYISGQTVAVAFSITNGGDAFDGRYEVRIEDEQGVEVTLLSSTSIHDLIFGGTITRNLGWNTESTFAGAYRAVLDVWNDADELVSSESTNFAIDGSFQIDASVTTDQALYRGNSNVRVAGTVTYTAGNVVFEDASVNLRIIDESGNIMVETTESIASLLPGVSSTVTTDWNTANEPAGLYRAEIEVMQDGSSIVQSQADFRIETDIIRINGELSLSDDQLDPGAIQQVTYRVNNQGNVALSQVPVTISLVDASTQNVLEMQSLLVDIGVGGFAAGSVDFATAGLSLGTFTLLLQAELPDATGVPTLLNLNSASFSLQDRIAPILALIRPLANGFINTEDDAHFTAVDNLTGIDQTAIQVNDGDWISATVRDLANNEYGADFPALTETTHSLRARAIDAAGNTGFSETISFTVDNTAPVITVDGVIEGEVYTSAVTPVITITELNVDETYVTVNDTSFASGTPITEEGRYFLSVDVTDLAGNIGQAFVSFVIDKGPPVIEVAGVTDGQLTNTSVVPEITVTDSNLNETIYLLNGESFISGTEITDEGVYALEIAATDLAGFNSSQTINFEIDLTAPSLVITAPNDGAVVDTATIDITGQTEPGEIISLDRADESRVSVVADANGDFIFDSVNLLDGDNLFTLTVVDLAGNIGNEVVLTVVRMPMQQIELNGSLVTKPQILVLMPGVHRHDDNTDTDVLPLEQTLIDVFEHNGYHYLITDNEIDFRRAMYSKRYNMAVIADAYRYGHDSGQHGHCFHHNHHGPHYSHDRSRSDYHHQPKRLYLSNVLKNELRLNVAGGLGLVMLMQHPCIFNNLPDVLGAITTRHHDVDQDGAITLIDSPLGDATALSRSGDGAILRNLGGLTVGTFELADKPALVINTYRGGKTALLGIDPSDLEDTDQARTLLTNLFGFVTPQASSLYPGSVVDLQWSVSEAQPPLEVSLTQYSEPGVELLSVVDGDIVDSQTALWERSLDKTTAEFNALIRLPFEKSDLTINADLAENLGGVLNSLQVTELLISVDRDINDQAAEVLATMQAIDTVFRSDAHLLFHAIELVEVAVGIPPTNSYALVSIFWHLQAAYYNLDVMHVDAGEAQAQLGSLYRLYQLEAYRLNNPLINDD